MKPVTFRRSTKPERAVGRPWLVGFHDGSLSAYAAVVYVVWTVEVSGGAPSGGPLSGGPLSGAQSEIPLISLGVGIFLTLEIYPSFIP